MQLKPQRRSASIAVLAGALVAFLVAPTTGSPAASGGSFNLADYSTGVGGGGGCFKRGYVFTVAAETIVTGLTGGGRNGTFYVGIYEGKLETTSSEPIEPSADGTYANGRLTPTALLGSITFSRDGNANRELDSKPLVLPSC